MDILFEEILESVSFHSTFPSYWFRFGWLEFENKEPS